MPLQLRLCPGLTSFAGSVVSSRQPPDVKGSLEPRHTSPGTPASHLGHQVTVSNGRGGGTPFWHDTSWQRWWDTPLPDPGHHLLSACHQSSPLEGRPLDYGLPPLATQKVTSHTRSPSYHHSCQRLTFVKYHPVNRWNDNVLEQIITLILININENED